MQIKKAVIPAAGLGTRMLPIARVVPKEMLPIVDRPALSFLVEEAVQSGVTDILIITGRDKDAIENYFDYSIEYRQKLEESKNEEALEEIRRTCNMANIHYIRQKETKGLGHAISCAKTFVGQEPFLVLYGDDVIFSQTPVCKQLITAYEEYGIGIAGVKEVPLELVMKYCSLKAEGLHDNYYHVTDMIEKPKENQIYTKLSILGRVLLPPEIFDILEQTPPGAKGEIQLTDAMCTLAQTRGMIAVDFEGERFDLGAKIGFLKANVMRGVLHEEVGAEFREFLKEFAKTL